jgi:hypothetical protein
MRVRDIQGETKKKHASINSNIDFLVSDVDNFEIIAFVLHSRCNELWERMFNTGEKKGHGPRIDYLIMIIYEKFCW